MKPFDRQLIYGLLFYIAACVSSSPFASIPLYAVSFAFGVIGSLTLLACSVNKE